MPSDVQERALTAALQHRSITDRRWIRLLGIERHPRAARGRVARSAARNELWDAIGQLGHQELVELARHAIHKYLKAEPVAVANEATAAVHEHLNRSQR